MNKSGYWVTVKGKDQSIPVYDVFNGDSEELIELKLKTKDAIEEGLKLYHNKEFAKAGVEFDSVKKANPDDKAAVIYLERTAQLMVTGVPDDWEGDEVMDGK